MRFKFVTLLIVTVLRYLYREICIYVDLIDETGKVNIVEKIKETIQIDITQITL